MQNEKLGGNLGTSVAKLLVQIVFANIYLLYSGVVNVACTTTMTSPLTADTV